MTSLARLTNVVETDIGAGPTLIPPGVYQLRFDGYKLISRFRRGVLEMWFSVVDFGPYFGMKVPRYYNVDLSPKLRNFRARPQSAFCMEHCKLFGHRPKPIGTCALVHYQDKYIVGLIGNVVSDYRQKPLPESGQYGTVHELLHTV